MRAGLAIVALQVAAVAGVITYAGGVLEGAAHGAPAPVEERFFQGETRVFYQTHPRIRPCPTDEGPDGVTVRPCVWDARHAGDGAGHSFRVTRSGSLIYLTHARAHALLNHHGKASQ